MSLPRARDFEIAAVTAYLRHLHWSNRPPEASARVLVFAVHMHWFEDHRPWPTRPIVARHLRMPEITLDKVLRQRGEEGLLRRVINYQPNRTLYVIPHADLMGVVAGSRFRLAA